MEDLSALVVLLAFAHVALKLWVYNEWEAVELDIGRAVIYGIER